MSVPFLVWRAPAGAERAVVRDECYDSLNVLTGADCERVRSRREPGVARRARARSQHERSRAGQRGTHVGRRAVCLGPANTSRHPADYAPPGGGHSTSPGVHRSSCMHAPSANRRALVLGHRRTARQTACTAPLRTRDGAPAHVHGTSARAKRVPASVDCAFDRRALGIRARGVGRTARAPAAVQRASVS
jgi:hypothetical protein